LLRQSETRSWKKKKMKATINIREMVAEGQRLEKAGELPDAAAAYQKVVDNDGSNPEAVGRLLVVYRKLKEYGKELAVVNRALAAYKQRDKAQQEKWLKEHPNAAGAGKAIFRKLGGTGMPGADSVVDGLMRRKGFLERRIAGGKGKKQAIVRRIAPKRAAGRSKNKGAALAETKKAERAATVAARKKATATRKKEERDRKAAAAAQRREEAVARKAAADPHPSLFVISLHYLVPLEEIDAAMPRHTAFLDKHYKQGDFLVSGRQVPRSGGVIIARGKNREAVERMMRQDPFVKGKLASMDIVEFSASQMGKGLEKWMKR
jgi:uncharacterized protein YciI